MAASAKTGGVIAGYRGNSTEGCGAAGEGAVPAAGVDAVILPAAGAAPAAADNAALAEKSMVVSPGLGD